jgi:hypothetical protein
LWVIEYKQPARHTQAPLLLLLLLSLLLLLLPLLLLLLPLLLLPPLSQAGVAESKWAIEYEQPAADAFKLNNPHSAVYARDCNAILTVRHLCMLHVTNSNSMAPGRGAWKPRVRSHVPHVRVLFKW